MVIMLRAREFVKAIPILGSFVRLCRRIALNAVLAVIKATSKGHAFLRCCGVAVNCDLNDPTHAWYLGSSANLLADQWLMSRLVRYLGDHVFIDVGGHFGFYGAAFASEVGRQALSHAVYIGIEPNPKAFHCLSATMRKSGLTRALLLNAAAGAKEGRLPMFCSDDAPCHHSYGDADGIPAYTVDSVTVDAALARSPYANEKVGLIKIDVDGFEPQVYSGAVRTIQRHSPFIMLEYSPEQYDSAGFDAEAFIREVSSSYHLARIDYAPVGLRPVTVEELELARARNPAVLLGLLLIPKSDRAFLAGVHS